MNLARVAAVRVLSRAMSAGAAPPPARRVLAGGKLVASQKTGSGLEIEHWRVAGPGDPEVVLWRLARPQQYNALTEDLIADLSKAADAVKRGNAKTLRAVVIEGSGKAFCAGHDMKEMMEPEHQQYTYYRDLFERSAALMMSIRELSQPVVTVVDGVATAAGLQLVCASDLCIATDRARFGATGINFGLFCSVPAVPLARSIPRKVALDMLCTGEMISGARAHELGLVSRVVATTAESPWDPCPELADARDSLVRTLVTKSGAALAVGKTVFYDQIHMRLQHAYVFAADHMARNMMLDETQVACDAKFGTGSK